MRLSASIGLGVVFGALMTALSPASVAWGQVVTLQQLRARALKGRPELALQDARLAGAEARVAQAKTPLLPRVSGRVEANASPGSELVTVNDINTNDEFIVAGSKTIDDGLDAFDPQLRYSARLGVTWNVWDFGRTDAATQAARAELRARQAEAAQTREALIVAVDEVYIEWLGAYERARLEARTIERLNERIAGLKTKISAGGLAPSALLPLEADLAGAELRRDYAEGAVEIARLAVEDAVAQPLAPNAIPDSSLLDAFERPSTNGDPPSAEKPAEKPDEKPAEKPDEKPDRAADALAARADAARATARLHEKRYAPQLSASASAGLRGQLDTLFPFYIAGVGLEIPLYDGGEGSARAAAARADAKALEEQLAQRASEQSRTRVRGRLRLAQARRRVVLAQKLVQATEARLKDTVERYEEAAARSNELIDAQAQNAQAGAQLLTAKLDRARAALALER